MASSGQAREILDETGHSAIIKPIPLRPAVPGGFTLDDFDIDHTERRVTCPAGNSRDITVKGNATFGALCRGCPLRAQCTTSKSGRTIVVGEHEARMRAARRQAETDSFKDLYTQKRPMVERSLAWLVRRGNRKLRYRGVAKNDQWLHRRAASLNLRSCSPSGSTMPTAPGYLPERPAGRRPNGANGPPQAPQTP